MKGKEVGSLVLVWLAIALLSVVAMHTSSRIRALERRVGVLEVVTPVTYESFIEAMETGEAEWMQTVAPKMTETREATLEALQTPWIPTPTLGQNR